MGSFISADLLASMRGLPLTALISTALVGLGLIGTGWWLHRFWAALVTTFTAGLIGLRLGPDYGMQPIVAGVLAAVAAGCLALSLVRVAMFVGCGVGCWLIAQAYMPKEPTPMIALMAGGLFGVFCYRFWVILVTSTAGVLFVLYNFLILLEKMMKFDAVAWTTANAGLANSIMVGAILSGVLFQYWLNKFLKQMAGWKEEWESLQAKASQSGTRGWLGWLKKAA